MFVRYTRKPTEMLRLLSKSKEAPGVRGGSQLSRQWRARNDGWGMALRWRQRGHCHRELRSLGRARAAFRCYGLWFQQGDSVRS